MKNLATAALLITALLLSAPSQARQTARVVQEKLDVYERPKKDTPPIGVLEKGTKLPSSSGMARDAEGGYWYKVRLSQDRFGYVEADGLSPSSIEKGMKDAGIQFTDEMDAEGDSNWNFVLRGMGLGGAKLTPTGLVYGGEGEFSFCIPFAWHGYLHRMLSVGATYIYMNNEPVAAGSLILRIYTQARIEPELRFRFGYGMQTSTMQGGVNIGIRYPLSLYPGSHFSSYFELGSLTPLTFSSATLWASAGLGLHF